MIYKQFQDLSLSALGLGNMRLPVINDNNADIDVEQVKEMFAYAMEHGINYYDTAWGYHEGNSETVVGEVLKQYPRDSFYIATKFPGYDLSMFGKHEEIFEKQMEKLQMDYFDFYLFHNVCELNIEHYLDMAAGPKEYLVKQKEAGRIRHLGFSDHGSVETTKRFLDAYEDCIEFCQIQLNWLDWDFQEAKAKVALLKERNIPVWVMEPLRGGMLCNLSDEAKSRLKELRPEESIPGWSFRYLQSIPEVTMILSGMSNFTQLKENISTFETEAPATEEEKKVLYEIAESMMTPDILPCTGCRYCTKYCPKQLDIPGFIKVYNEEMLSGYGFRAPMFVNSFPFERQPQNCSHCRMCESMCPQKLKISDMMIDLTVRVKRNPFFQ